MNKISNIFVEKSYKLILKPIFFKIDPERVHVSLVNLGEILGNSTLSKNIFSKSFKVENLSLKQNILGIDFDNPIGLAAGFDYEAKLTQICSHLGFGFQTIGTVTYQPYEGNAKPRLGRLPKSRSLMINKGFKNLGAVVTAKKLKNLKYTIPLGISIGRTNSATLTQKDSIKDIINAFSTFEAFRISNSFYELNISCPNLHGYVTFYNPKNLDDLLKEIDKLNIKKPVFVKMPIILPDKETLDILNIIEKHSPKGIIIGNLQNDRNHSELHQSEIVKYKVGNFSGKPTYDRSNHLIKLAYSKYKNRFVIIGCGGIFKAEDAYEKIKSGASLVQLITGMIFEGPQLISQINSGLSILLKKDGFRNIYEAVGSNA